MLFRTLGYSGMFVMAGGFSLLGVLVTFCVPEDIKYERENKRNVSGGCLKRMKSHVAKEDDYNDVVVAKDVDYQSRYFNLLASLKQVNRKSQLHNTKSW